MNDATAEARAEDRGEPTEYDSAVTTALIPR